MGLSIGVIGVAATELVQAETQSNVEDEYESVARQEADILEQWIERNSVSTRLVSGKPVWTFNQNLSAHLENELQYLPSDAANIHIVRPEDDGATIVDSTTYRKGAAATLVGRSWLNNVSLDGVNEVERSETFQSSTGSYQIAFASPVSQATDDRFIVVDYDIANITQSLQGADRAEGGFTRVVSGNNVVMIAEPEDVGPGVGDTMLNEYAEQESATQPLDAATDLRGSGDEGGVITEMSPTTVIDERYTVGYSPVEGTNWVVLVHAPYSSVFGFVQQIQTWGLVATVLMVLLVGGVGAVLGWSTSSSIDRLTKKTEEMREGNLDVDLSTNRIDNIGRLYAGFGAMRDSLREQIDEAERARKEAEVSRAEAMEMNQYLEEKAEEFSIVMERAAAGDLTARMATDGENEAMDTIATEYNEMIEELEKTTGQLKSFADEVAESGDVVLQSAESVQMISDDAYGQKERLATVSQDLDQLVETLERLEAENPQLDIDDSIEQFSRVASTLQAAADRSEDMLAESENVAGAAEEQAAELNEVSSRADQLKRYARPLGDILERFETEAEHEFVFSGGPSQTTRPDAENDD